MACFPATDQHVCTSQGILYRIALDNVDFCILTDQTLRSTPDLERRIREIDSKAPFPEGPIKWETLLGCKLAVKTSGCGPELVQSCGCPGIAALFGSDQAVSRACTIITSFMRLAQGCAAAVQLRAAFRVARGNASLGYVCAAGLASPSGMLRPGGV
jgi:hypothetical protein